MRLDRCALLALTLSIACLPAMAQEQEQEQAQAKSQPLFEEESALEATLRGPLGRAYRQGPKAEPSEFEGQWRYENAEGETVELKVEFRQRGNMRRVACSLPPLRLDFVKSEVAGTLFDGQNKLKLVGVCERDRDYRDYVMLEYLTYRAYALLTPASLDTRLLELRYDDTVGSASMRRPGFLIEDIDALAARLGMKELGTPYVNREDLDPDASAVAELFAYMIGNTDFSTIRGAKGEDCCHNVKLLTGGEGGIVPVPYDFDSAGLVDTPYALPAKKLPIKDTRTRLFRGICKAPEHFERARTLFLEREDEILGLFGDRKAIGTRTRVRAQRYLRTFFEVLSDPERFERDVVAACVGGAPKD